MPTSWANCSITRSVADLEDPRLERSRWHNLLDLVVIAVCAVSAGAEGWEDIAKYGHAKAAWLKTFVVLPNGIPSHDTFRRVFCWLDPEALQECFRRWIDALSDGLGRKRIAIDDKTVRRSFAKATGKAALYLVRAWATERRCSGSGKYLAINPPAGSVSAFERPIQEST